MEGEVMDEEGTNNWLGRELNTLEDKLDDWFEEYEVGGRLLRFLDRIGYVVVKKEDHSMGVQLANEYLRRIAEKDISPFEREEKYIGVDEPCPTCERIDCICDLKEHGFVVEKEERDEI
jgi:hypothetical protein